MGKAASHPRKVPRTDVAKIVAAYGDKDARKERARRAAAMVRTNSTLGERPRPQASLPARQRERGVIARLRSAIKRGWA